MLLRCCCCYCSRQIRAVTETLQCHLRRRHHKWRSRNNLIQYRDDICSPALDFWCRHALQDTGKLPLSVHLLCLCRGIRRLYQFSRLQILPTVNSQYDCRMCTGLLVRLLLLRFGWVASTLRHCFPLGVRNLYGPIYLVQSLPASQAKHIDIILDYRIHDRSFCVQLPGTNTVILLWLWLVCWPLRWDVCERCDIQSNWHHSNYQVLWVSFISSYLIGYSDTSQGSHWKTSSL